MSLSVAPDGSSVQGTVLGDDGNIWFTNGSGSGDVPLGRMTPTGDVTPFRPPGVTHAFAIKSAMLMSRLGAGCADD